MLEGRRVIACDGKSLRGARDAAGHLTHLLSALCQHTGTVLGQLSVGAKTNEIHVLRMLLDTMDISGAVITADALHTQRGTAEYIVSRGAHYILTVKQPAHSPRAAQSPAVEAGPGPGRRPRAPPRPHRHPVAEGHRDRGRHRLPARGASPATDQQDSEDVPGTARWV